MVKEIKTFGDIEIEKHKFHHYKSLSFQKIYQKRRLTRLFLKKKNCKYFIGCLFDDYKIKPLHIMIPKTSLHVNSYDGQSKQMYLIAKLYIIKKF